MMKSRQWTLDEMNKQMWPNLQILHIFQILLYLAWIIYVPKCMHWQCFNFIQYVCQELLELYPHKLVATEYICTVKINYRWLLNDNLHSMKLVLSCFPWNEKQIPGYASYSFYCLATLSTDKIYEETLIAEDYFNVMSYT